MDEVNNLIPEIRKLISTYLEYLPNKNYAIEINGSRFIHIKLCCSGKNEMYGLYCSLTPNHKGKCYSNNKKSYFFPTDETSEE